MRWRSMDDLPDVIHSFWFRVDLADILIGECDDLSTEQRDSLGTFPGDGLDLAGGIEL